MGMKKWLLSGSSLLLVASLFGCSAGQTTTAPEAQNGGAEGNKTKLVYWTIDRHDSDFIEAKVAEYQKLNPDVEIEMKVMADNYTQSVDIAFASNQAPDILRATNVPTWVKRGYLEPLDEFITPEMKERFANLLIEEKNMVDGKIYTLPNTGQFWRLIYNVDLFKKAGIDNPPTTLAEMIEDAKKITEAGKDSGAYGFAGNFKSGSGFERIAYPITSLSKNVGNEGFDLQKGQFDFGMYKEVAEALRQMKEDGSMLPGSESLDIDPLRAQFAQGKIGMYFNHSAEPAVYKSQFPTEINWAASMPPTIDGTIHGADQVISGSYLALSKTSQNKEAAWKFIQWMYSSDVQVPYQEAGNGVSVIPSVASVAKAPDIPGIEYFLPTKYDAIYPATPMTVTEGYVEGVKKSDVFNRYIFAGGDLDKDIQDLNTRYNAALEKARAAGDTAIVANPDFNAENLQGTLSEKE